MPFSRPTLSDLRSQIAGDIDAALPGADALLRYSNLKILGEALAGAVNGLYGYLDWIARQSVPFTATDEYLEGWAGLKGITRKPATNAAGSATFTGTNGAIIPAGTTLTRSDGMIYTTLADATIASGTASAEIEATVAGTDGNAADGITLTLGLGISGVNPTASAAGAIASGADIEPDDELRTRMLAIFASPPQGGNIGDYGNWVTSVPGVTRCWIVPSGMGPGTIVLMFMMDDANSAHAGFPQGTDGVAADEARDTAASGDQLTVANAIFPLQPPTALIYAVAPQPNAIDFTISGLAAASTVTKQTVEAAIDAALKVGAQPGGITPVSLIEAAIAAVPLTTGFVITAVAPTHGSVSPGSAGNITSDPGRLPVRGSVTFA